VKSLVAAKKIVHTAMAQTDLLIWAQAIARSGVKVGAATRGVLGAQAANLFSSISMARLNVEV
jgi:hypothetical protein